MFMQFNHPKLGKWQQDVGEFKQIRCITIFSWLYIDVLTYPPPSPPPPPPPTNQSLSNLQDYGVCEMEGTVVIDSNLLKDQASLLYKYLVYSPTTVGNNSPYEFLHNAPASVWGKKDVSRRIFIPKSRFQSNGMRLCAIILLYRYRNLKMCLQVLFITMTIWCTQSQNQETFSLEPLTAWLV